MKIERGATRIVLVTKSFVIKVPNFSEWRLFLQGLLDNMSERQWSGYHADFAKVTHSSRIGLWLTMEKADVVSNDVDWDEFKSYLEYKYKDDDLREFILSDCKPSNWGYIGEKLVKIDYA